MTKIKRRIPLAPEAKEFNQFSVNSKFEKNIHRVIGNSWENQ